MTSTTQRHLVNVDMLLSDIDALKQQPYSRLAHSRLLTALKNELAALSRVIEHETVYSFHQAVVTIGLESTLPAKRMADIYARLINYVLEYWEAQEKVDSIIDSCFDTNAEKRLQLLQVKAIRAKTQFKTVAKAMGDHDYTHCIAVLGLSQENWVWQN
ncbi:hypothetical protein [Aestuariibacter sp. A3R04]|uniref:hypothetical protein n=1 Tax=Aestuariibacter sp. A3R04 TaxID=2841571 RepID=UPI001C0A122C|nr:hypothetical protein [Aestuariibacter sp. A3R04]MBU3023165.1 hypothetical protein [Aestuariibacter sp. A3R04]